MNCKHCGELLGPKDENDLGYHLTWSWCIDALQARAEEAEAALAAVGEALLIEDKTPNLVEAVTAEARAIRHGAHAPDDWPHNLASWINQHLYASYIGLRFSPEVLEDIASGRVSFPESPAYRRMLELEEDNAALRAQLDAAVEAAREWQNAYAMEMVFNPKEERSYVDNPIPPTGDTARRRLAFGMKFPYDNGSANDWMSAAAYGILADLLDRRGIRHELEQVDDDVRTEIVETISWIIRVSHDEWQPMPPAPDTGQEPRP